MTLHCRIFLLIPLPQEKTSVTGIHERRAAAVLLQRNELQIIDEGMDIKHRKTLLYEDLDLCFSLFTLPTMWMRLPLG